MALRPHRCLFFLCVLTSKPVMDTGVTSYYWRRVLRPMVIQRDGPFCQIEEAGCMGRGGRALKEADIDIDHILPRKYGGTERLDNLRVSCKRCNRRREYGRRKSKKWRTARYGG